MVGAAAVAGLLILVPMSPASAGGGECAQWDDLHQQCLVWVTVPGDDGEDDDGDPGGTQQVGSTTCVYNGQDIPCRTGYGTWNSGRQCYMRQLTPSQVASDPELAAQAQQNPGKKAYLCRQILSTVGPLVDPGDVVWDDGIDTIDPRVAARILALSLGIDAIDLGLSPRLKGGPAGRATVGIPVWMWAANPARTTVGPISARRAWPGVVITGEARLTEVAWSMGDGTTVRCKGEGAKGTVYNTSYGVTDSPTCGHRYKKMSTGQPGNRYRVTATSHWVFEWQGGGMQGAIPLDVEGSTTLPVGELQVVVTSR